MSKIEEAIEKAGGVVSLAKACGVDHSTVIFWRTSGSIPLRRIPSVAKAARLTKEYLCPEIFGEDKPLPERRPAKEGAAG
ncbi:carph-isopro domain-containing protein [Kozakia baliensis]|uniref:carph-isopro domain-containing protein n=1 Tax=Kozakia baliensis TaxID=153496 RepID=UPI0013637950